MLVDLAKYTAQKYNIDVFLVERPPRYDKERNDPKGHKQMLSQTANGLLMSMITPLEHVHLVKLPGLDNLPVKVKKGVYQHDGIHLTKRGASLLADHIISGVRDVFKDIPVPFDVPLRNQFNTPPPQLPRVNRHPGQGGPYHPQGQHGGYSGGAQRQQGRSYHEGGHRRQTGEHFGYNQGRRDDDMPDFVRDYNNFGNSRQGGNWNKKRW